MDPHLHPNANPRRIEQLRHTFKEKRSRGEVTGRVPIGYMRLWDSEAQVSRIVPNLETHPLVQEAKQLRAEGMSIREISRAMAEKGLLSRGKPIGPSSMLKVLNRK